NLRQSARHALEKFLGFLLLRLITMRDDFLKQRLGHRRLTHVDIGARQVKSGVRLPFSRWRGRRDREAVTDVEAPAPPAGCSLDRGCSSSRLRSRFRGCLEIEAREIQFEASELWLRGFRRRRGRSSRRRFRGGRRIKFKIAEIELERLNLRLF